MSKNKVLAAAAAKFAQIKKDAPKKEKLGVPEVGDYQVEVTKADFGQDNFSNVAFNFEFKVLSEGPNKGRTLKKSLPLEYNPKEGHTMTTDEVEEVAEKKLVQAGKFLDSLGVHEFDRDLVEALEGSVIEINLWKHKEWDATKWPTIYARKMITPSQEMTEGDAAVTSESVDDEDELNYEE